MKRFTLEEVRKVIHGKGYDWFDGGKPYNMNLIGIRNDIQRPERFDDFVLAIFRNDRGNWEEHWFAATTDPGLYWLQNPINNSGTAILCPGQYPGCYKIGSHKDYEALEQVADMTYVRDDDQDDRLDLGLMHRAGEKFSDNIKTNLHRANPDEVSTHVWKWSAGCQVIAHPAEFQMLLGLCRRSAEHFYNSFTYTLLTVEDFE